MNISILPTDILHTIFMVLTPNVNNVIYTCKLFNSLIQLNIVHFYEKDNFKIRKPQSLKWNMIRMECICNNQKYDMFTDIILIKSQYKIYEHNLKCKIIMETKDDIGCSFIKNEYNKIGLDYVEYNDHNMNSYIVPVFNGYSSICFLHNKYGTGGVCTLLLTNNEINTLECNKFIIQLFINKNIRLIPVMENFHQILENALSSIDNYNLALAKYTNPSIDVLPH